MTATIEELNPQFHWQIQIEDGDIFEFRTHNSNHRNAVIAAIIMLPWRTKDDPYIDKDLPSHVDIWSSRTKPMRFLVSRKNPEIRDSTSWVLTWMVKAPRWMIEMGYEDGEYAHPDVTKAFFARSGRKNLKLGLED